MLVVPAVSPSPAMPTSQCKGSPEAKAISHSTSPVSEAVLRLGCLRINRMMPPRIAIHSTR